MSDWHESALHEVLVESVKEQRRRRRWGIFFKLCFLGIFSFFVYNIYFADDGSKKLRGQAHTALIDINGVISDGGDSDADRIATSLRHAFDDKGTRGIILRINSPGGSGVQADYVYKEIRRMSALHPKIKVYAVCTDICASAAYYIASSTSEIYADPLSLVGSIGVIMDGFGFVGSMEKLGVSRRLFTAGNHKGFLDPFSPLKPDEVKAIHTLLDQVHQEFIDNVKEGRGKRLKSDPDLFSGMIWNGLQAKELGLIDNLGSTGYVAREVIKAEKIVDYTIRPNYFERLAGRIGATAGEQISKDLGLTQNLKIK